MITAIAVDDEPLALIVIEAFCKKADNIELQKTFTEPSEALKYLKKYPVDLLFLDIRMPSISGIDFYKSVPESTMVIFTTAFSEYAVEGFNLKAMDYLLKPFEYDRFKQAIDKANEQHTLLKEKQDPSGKYLFIRVDYSLMKIAYSDIVYVEGLDNYLKIHLVTSKTILVRMSMKAMSDKLPEKEFIMVHRSYIVAFNRINSVRNKIIYLDQAEIPVGTNYAEKVNDLFQTD